MRRLTRPDHRLRAPFWKSALLTLSFALSLLLGGARISIAQSSCGTRFADLLNAQTPKLRDQCGSGTCWLQAGTTYVERALKHKLGTTTHLSADYLYYHHLRSMLVDTLSWTPNVRQDAKFLIDEGQHLSRVRGLIERFGLMREEDWKPASDHSIFKDSLEIRKQFEQILLESAAEEKAANLRFADTYGFYPDRIHPKDVERINQVRLDAIAKADRVLEPYIPKGASAGAIDPQALELATLLKSSFASDHQEVRLVRDHPLGAPKEVAAITKERIRFFEMTKPVSSNTLNVRTREAFVTSRTISLSRDESARELRRMIQKNGAAVLVIRWNAFYASLGLEPKPSQHKLHAIVATLSPKKKNRVILQNSWGSHFGDQGRIEVPISQILPHLESFEAPFSHEALELGSLPARRQKKAREIIPSPGPLRIQ